jgi:hypothetical protein
MHHDGALRRELVRVSGNEVEAIRASHVASKQLEVQSRKPLADGIRAA